LIRPARDARNLGATFQVTCPEWEVTENDRYQYKDKILCHHGWLALKKSTNTFTNIFVKFCQERLL
jgi:hypothetical protein